MKKILLLFISFCVLFSTGLFSISAYNIGKKLETRIDKKLELFYQKIDKRDLDSQLRIYKKLKTKVNLLKNKYKTGLKSELTSYVYNEIKKKYSEVFKNSILEKDIKDWKIYRSSKYSFEFKYPGNWYIYNNKSMQACKYRNIDENVIILSRRKLTQCEAGYQMLSNWNGDILIVVEEIGTFKNMDNIYTYPKAKSCNIWENNNKKFKCYLYPFLENAEGPRSRATQLFIQSSDYEYRIEIKQNDIKGNIDFELINIFNTFLIK